MKEVYFGNFRLVVLEEIRLIQTQQPESHSVEWFLLRYLKRIEQHTNPPSTPVKVDNSIRALVRFYVDMIDEDSELGERCRFIYEQYRKTLREDPSRE